jgi:glutaredoxin-like protein NrdH
MEQMSEQGVVVYTTGPACIRCTMTKRVLEQKGVPFTEVDIRENSAARDYVALDLGYTEAPVVVVSDEDHWSGFRPDQIDRLIKTDRRESCPSAPSPDTWPPTPRSCRPAASRSPSSA